MHRSLDAEIIVRQLEALHQRVSERFPERNLTRVSAELCTVAQEARETAEWIARPHLVIRIITALVLTLLLILLATAIFTVTVPEEPLSFTEFVQVVEAGINDIVLLGAAIFFLVSMENRIKRHRALSALHRLRALAHVIDMHQLTKDPVRILDDGPDTASSPQQSMTSFELNRYLDYCSELLAFIGKLAALYVQDFDDSVALAAVDEIQDLTTGLSQKIWQKIMIIYQYT